jgi:hypothetical protein
MADNACGKRELSLLAGDPQPTRSVPRVNEFAQTTDLETMLGSEAIHRLAESSKINWAPKRLTH